MNSKNLDLFGANPFGFNFQLDFFEDNFVTEQETPKKLSLLSYGLEEIKENSNDVFQCSGILNFGSSSDNQDYEMDDTENFNVSNNSLNSDGFDYKNRIPSIVNLLEEKDAYSNILISQIDETPILGNNTKTNII